MKTCSKCGELKPLESFTKEKNGAKGVKSKCKECVKQYNIIYYQSERGKEIKKAYQQSEKGKEYKKTYQQSEKGKESNKNYQQTEKYKVCQKNYSQSEKYKKTKIKYRLTKQIGEAPPPELVEVKLLINKTKRLCKTLKS